MSFTQTTNYLLYKPGFDHAGWYTLHNTNMDTIDAQLLRSGLGFFNVKDYGAVGDGSTDDRAAIQAAITAAGSIGAVYFPAATYKINAALTNANNVALIGAGSAKSIISVNFDAADVLTMGGASDTAINMQGLGFTRTALTYMTSGAMIVVKNVTNGTVHDIAVRYAFDCFRFERTLLASYSNLWLVSTNSGLRFKCTASQATQLNAGQFSNISWYQGNNSTTVGTGIELGPTTVGLNFVNIFLQWGKYAVNFVPSTVSGFGPINELNFANCFFDNPSVGIHVDAGGHATNANNSCTFTNIRISQAATTAFYGVQLEPPMKNFKFANCLIHAGDIGVILNGVSGCVFTGCTITTQANAKYGVLLQGAANTNNLFTGNSIGGSDEAVASAVAVVAGAQAHQGNKFIGNDLSGATAATSWASTSTDNRFQHNPGIDDVIGSVASATSIAAPLNPCFSVTGTTAVTTITGGWTGRQIRMKTPSGVSFNTGGNILKQVVSAANQTVSGFFDGTNWSLQ